METTGQVLRRVRLEQHDKLWHVASYVGTSIGAVNAVERCHRNVPLRWLSVLPPAYAVPIIGAMIELKFAEIRVLSELVAQKEESPGCYAGAQLGEFKTGTVK